jgi:hypothetical protein
VLLADLLRRLLGRNNKLLAGRCNRQQKSGLLCRAQLLFEPNLRKTAPPRREWPDWRKWR